MGAWTRKCKNWGKYIASDSYSPTFRKNNSAMLIASYPTYENLLEYKFPDGFSEPENIEEH